MDAGDLGVSAVFIFQIEKDLILATGAQVVMQNGGLLKNVFWKVAGFVEVGEGALLQGIVLTATQATFKKDSALHGRLLAQTRVKLQSNIRIDAKYAPDDPV